MTAVTREAILALVPEAEDYVPPTADDQEATRAWLADWSGLQGFYVGWRLSTMMCRECVVGVAHVLRPSIGRLVLSGTGTPLNSFASRFDLVEATDPDSHEWRCAHCNTLLAEWGGDADSEYEYHDDDECGECGCDPCECDDQCSECGGDPCVCDDQCSECGCYDAAECDCGCGSCGSTGDGCSCDICRAASEYVAGSDA